VNGESKPNFLKPRWSKVFTDLWADKTRTGLVVTSIAVGAFAIGMIISAYVILSQDINRSYAAVDPPNIVILTDPYDKAFIQTIQNLPDVNQVEGRRIVDIRAQRGTEDWQNLTLVGVSSFSSPINRLVPILGTQYPRDDEVIVSQNLMFTTGYKPGDIIKIEIPDGSIHSLTVVGLVTDQTTSKPDPNSSNNAFVSMKTLDLMGIDSNFNQLYVTVKGGGSDPAVIARVAASIKAQVKNSQRTVYSIDQTLSTEHPMTSSILAVIGIMAALGALITVLSSSLIINTLNGMLTQQLRQIGIMKLVGARSFQILGMYITLILAYGVIALLLAVPLGAIAGYGLAWFIANLMGAGLQGFRIIPAAVLTQVFVGILIPLGAGFFPVNNGAKVNVQRAISNYRPGSRASKKNHFRLNPKAFAWISRPILLSFRNTFRKRGRLLLTLFTLTMAGAVFIAVFNARDSMHAFMDQLMQHFMGDVTVDFRQPYRVARVEQTLLEIPGVKGVEGWGGVAGEIWDANGNLVTKLSIAAPPQDTQLLHPDFVAGRWLSPGEVNAIVISDSIYQFYPDLKPGDSVIIKIPGRYQEKWQVVGIFRFVAFEDPLAYANFDFIAGITHMPNQAASYRVITDVHDPASILTLTRRIDDTLRSDNYLVQSVQSGGLLREKATEALNILVTFLLIMAVLTAFVGSIGLTGTMSINVLERTREIGVMRTIGAIDRVIMQSVIVEALVIGVITWLLAIALSFPITYLLLNIIGKAMMGSPLATSFTPLGILVWLGVVLVLSVIASVIPARNAAGLTINEVLAYE
jgi:putative ABC transport system permease protein